MLLFYIEAGICLLFTIFLYFRFAVKNLRPYVTFLVILVWYLTFVTALIVPFDIYFTAMNIKTEGTNEETKAELFFFQVLYVVIYWLIYVLSWIIIPVAQEYERAGDFTPKDRLKRAIRTNLYIYLIFLVLGVFFIMYLVVKQQLTGERLLAFLITLSNAWGLFLIIVLLGYGLVAIPKHILKKSDYMNRIHYLEFHVAYAKDVLEERNIDLINCAHKIKTARSILDAEHSNPNRGFIEKIWLDLLNNYQIDQDCIVEEELKSYQKKFTYEELIDLNMNIKRNKYDIIRLKHEIDDIYNEWYLLKSYLGLIQNGLNYDKNCWNKFYKSYFLHVRPWILRIIAFFVIVMSLATLLSEITLFSNLPLSIFGLLIEQSTNIYVLNLLCVIPLIFMFLTSLYGLFKLKLAGYYTVHDNRQTDSYSLLFLASFMCRIGFPLCLNFVQILKFPLKTIIEWIMGETPDFGRNFMIFFPTILIVLCLFNLFDIYGRFMNLLGFNTFGFQSPENDDRIEEGNEILEKMRIMHERDNKNSIDSSINSKNDLSNNLISSGDEVHTKLVVNKY